MKISNVWRQKSQQSKEELLIKNLPQIMERNLIKKQNRKSKNKKGINEGAIAKIKAKKI